MTLFCVPQGAAQDVVLATVDDHEITADAFAKDYVDYLLRAGSDDGPRLRTRFLEERIADRLLITDGREAGLDRTTGYARFETAAREKLLIEGYLQAEVTGPVEVREADLEEAFYRMNTIVTARHLYARSEEEAWGLRKRLDDGETFEALAAEVFADSALAASGGALGDFTFDELDRNFEDAAYSLEIREISDPVRTAQGYSIVQVTNRYTKPIVSESESAAQREHLRSFLLRRKRLRARTQHARAIAENLDVRFHPAFDELLGQITGISLISDAELADFLDRPLLSFSTPEGRSQWTVGDFRRIAAHTDPAQRAQVRTAPDLRDFLTGLVVRSSVLERARERGIETRPEYLTALEQVLDDWILQERREQIASAVVVAEDSVRAHYEQHPNEFIQPDGARKPFSEARSQIEHQLRTAYGDRSIAAHVRALRQTSRIEVRPDVLRRISVRMGGLADDLRRPSETALGGSSRGERPAGGLEGRTTNERFGGR